MEFLKLNIQLFASATKSTTLTSTAGNTATLTGSFTEATLTSEQIESNKTSITASATITMTTGSFSSINSAYLRLYWHGNKNDNDIEVANVNLPSLAKKASKTITATFDVEHRDDGTLSGYVIAKWDYSGTNQYCPKGGTAQTDTTKLTTIPRATATPSLTAYVDDTTQISLSPSSTSFTHTIKYKFGSLSGTIATGVTKSASWTIPTTFYSQIASDKSSAEGTLTVETYNGTTLVGTTSNTFVAMVSDKAKPVIEITSVVDANTSTSALTGNSAVMIKYGSTARVTFTATANPIANTKLKSLTINNIVIPTNTTTYDIPKINTDTITIVAVDERDLTTTEIYTIKNIVDYTQLTSSPTVIRKIPVVDNQLTLSGKGSYFATNFGATTNTLNIQYRYKLNNDASYSSWYSITPTIDATDKSYSFNDTPTINFDYTQIYNLQIQVNDKVITHLTSVTIARGVPIFWFTSDSFTVEVTFNNKSLESRKKAFEDFDSNALDIINKGKIYKFLYDIDDTNSKKHLGFVIPDKGGDFLVPNEVISNDGTGIDIYGMTSICWKAIQEQQELINKLQDKIKEMEI